MQACRALARLHDAALPPAAVAWDYEAELLESARATLAAADARDATGGRWWRRSDALQRVVAELPRVRAPLLAEERAVIHGDVHPGNVIIHAATERVVLIDWGRARLGCPLEDVASWLHSLGCWEPQARRRHDTLLRAYLEARRVQRPLDERLRAHYWFASASNGLAGAIRYHLSVLAGGNAATSAQWHSLLALRAWERVIRQVARLLRTSPGRCT
jgi:aminoglycoside phosphotransferase (APT) family kinase protein